MNILYIAYYFPPDSSSGSFRPLHFANHLSRSGDAVHVLTARQEDYLSEQTVDSLLLEKLHPDVAVSRCRVWRARESLITLRNRWFRRGPAPSAHGTVAKVPFPLPRAGLWQQLKDLVSDLLIIPDAQAGWLPDCLREGIRQIRRRRPDLILATGGPWTGLVAGMILKKIFGVPLVVDFRDPWTSNPNAARRSSLATMVNRRLERMVVASADGVIANTDPLRDDFLLRYPFLEKERVITLTNGFEEYMAASKKGAGEPLTIVHTGELYLSRSPKNLLIALKLLIERGVVSPHEVKLVLVGGLQDDGPEVKSLLADDALRQVLTILPRLPYDETQKIALGADLLLLVQPDLPLQVPRKLYEYMAFRKPILSISEAGSATSRLVLENELGLVAANRVEEILSRLEEVASAWRAGALVRFSDGRCDSFLNQQLSSELRRFITSISGPKAASVPRAATRVAQVTLSMGLGGIENLILSLARVADGERVTHSIYCLDCGGALLAEAEELEVRTRVFSRRPGVDFQLILALARAFRADRINVVHTHNEAANFYGVIAAKIARIPVVINTEHSRHYIDLHWRRRLEKRILAVFADKVVTVSEELRRLSIDEDGVDQEKLEVILNGVNIKGFDQVARSEVEKLKAELLIPLGVPVVTIVARLHPIKNHVILLEAVKMLKASSQDLRVLVVGDGDERANLENMARQLDLSSSVLFLGSRRDIPVILKASDALVLCSISEGLPLVLLEGMASRTPVVVTNGANGSGVVKHGVTGIACGDTAEELAEAIYGIITGKAGSTTLTDAAYLMVSKSFSIQETANRYLDLYAKAKPV